ncbi:DNA/RNA non-specific endonuclease [Enterococcus pingfangensis]
MDVFLILVGVLGFIGFFINLIFRLVKKQSKKIALYGMLAAFILFVAGGMMLSPAEKHATTTSSSTVVENSSSTEKENAEQEKIKKEKLAKEKADKEKKEAEQKLAAEEKVKEAEAKKKAEEEKAKLAAEAEKTQLKVQTNKDLAYTEFSGIQTIDVNGGTPIFTDSDLSTENGAWEKYGELDSLNRATDAEALLNLAMQPTEKRESLTFNPTGWRNKKLNSGYLYNHSHLIGFQLSGENNNPKNLITGTRQLNSPEMLRFESDINYYLEQNPSAFVRYSVVPIFRDSELVARGVHMQAQSIGSDAIRFNVYIHNVQAEVTINYSDGTSQVSQAAQPIEEPEQTNPVPAETPPAPAAETGEMVYITPTGKRYHTHPHGNGNFTPSTLENAQAQGLTPCEVCY